ncbi:MAG: hypothetical protein RBT49_17670 [Bacteroidales bacterium]|nr:hypothetical protein [Bacteroidales bacterium]
MKQNDIHYYEWLLRKYARHIRHYKNRYKDKTTYDKSSMAISDHRYNAPENLSICGNSGPTIGYFQKYIRHLKNNKANFYDTLFFDVSNIKTLTIDALMYLLAIIKNFDYKIKYFKKSKKEQSKYPKYSELKIKKISGNLPNDPSIRTKFLMSGFLNYVSIPDKPVEKAFDNVQIREGSLIDTSVAREITTFVIDAFEDDRRNTKYIYNMLIELMSNTNNHAYEKEKQFINHWFIFARFDKNDEKIAITFLDTGEGIPRTVKKKLSEKVVYTDSQLIQASFDDSFNRSTTKFTHRGKGLPRIYDYCVKKRIDSITVISQKGKVVLMSNGENKIYNLFRPLTGTIYYWEIKKNNLRSEL